MGVDIKTIFGLDLRSLALFRVGIALCSLGDLIERAGDLSAHYTDLGFITRAVVAERYENPYSLNFHSVSGSFTYQSCIFLAHSFAALCLLVGYRTRLATFACWMLLVSLHSHNPFVNHGGDLYFRLQIFFGMFLPLGRFFSVDAALKRCKKSVYKKNINPRYFSAGTVALMSQIAVMYITSVHHKSGAEWVSEHTATWYALQHDYFRTSIGEVMLNYPELLKLLTWAVLKWEFWGPIMFFSPFYSEYFRLLGAVGFFFMHLGFVLCMRLGLFFYVCAVGTFVLIPTFVWDYFKNKMRTSERKSLSLYYHENSKPSKLVAFILQVFFLIPETGVYGLHALSESGVFSELYTNKIDELWLVVEDIQGNRYRNKLALQAAIAHAPVVHYLSKFNFLFTLPSYIISYFHAQSLQDPSTTSTTTFEKREPKSERRKRIMRIAGTVALAFLTIYVISWNMGNLGYQVPFRFPSSMNFIGYAFHIEQAWGMFSPHPPKSHWWYVIWAEQHDGKDFELFRNAGIFNWQGNTPFNLDKPSPFHESFKNHRWFKFFENGYNNKQKQDLRLSFGKWVCRSYNAIHSGNERLYHFRVLIVVEPQPLMAPRGERKSEELWEHICYEKDKKDK